MALNWLFLVVLYGAAARMSADYRRGMGGVGDDKEGVGSAGRLTFGVTQREIDRSASCLYIRRKLTPIRSCLRDNYLSIPRAQEKLRSASHEENRYSHKLQIQFVRVGD